MAFFSFPKTTIFMLQFLSGDMTVTYSLGTVRSNGLLCFVIQSTTDAVEFAAGMFSARRDDFSFLRPARRQMQVGGATCRHHSDRRRSRRDDGGQ